MRMRFFATVLVALPFTAMAQDKGELWEITSQMNIPGMPAGMGANTQRVCQGDDPERRAKSEKDQKDCKVTDKKQTATRLQVTMTCKQGTMTIDQQYNAAHTEFKGSMKMNSKDGDVTIDTTGRKVGACNVQQAAKERDEKAAAMKKQGEVAMAQGAAAQKQYADTLIKQCATAVDNMNWAGLGVYGQCYKKADDAKCKSEMQTSNQINPEIAKSCNARAAEFCKRYQTQDGFLKAKADENAAQDVQASRRPSEGGAVPESGADLACLPRRLLPGGGETGRPGALHRARLHLQDGRQVREVLQGLPGQRRFRKAASDRHRPRSSRA